MVQVAPPSPGALRRRCMFFPGRIARELKMACDGWPPIASRAGGTVPPRLLRSVGELWSVRPRLVA
jgi:hypothetical protein